MPNNRFEFTYNIYTGEKSRVIPPIREMILGIAVALESDDHWVYGGNRDEKDDVLEFLIDSEYITRLRWSPEYHDAVRELIMDAPGYEHLIEDYHHCEISYERYNDLMREYGVLGVIGIHNYNTYSTN